MSRLEPLVRMGMGRGTGVRGSDPPRWCKRPGRLARSGGCAVRGARGGGARPRRAGGAAAQAPRRRGARARLEGRRAHATGAAVHHTTAGW